MACHIDNNLEEASNLTEKNDLKGLKGEPLGCGEGIASCTGIDETIVVAPMAADVLIEDKTVAF